jgi:ribonucleotide reductase class II
MSQVSVFSQSSPILTGKDLHPEPSPASPAPVTRVSFPNALSQFVFTRTYPRWREEDNRRETYEEAVERYVSFLRAERDVPESVLKSIQEGILRMDVMPSMRAFWSAGDAALRDNTMFYNCSFIPLDSLKSFSELLYILMMGTGVGFSVEHRFVNNLPVVAPDVKMPCEEIDYVIEDSTVGWMEAVYDCLVHNFNGRIVRFDYSRIRPAGARLKTKGGRASGPEPLRRLLDFLQDTVLGAQGRKLSSVECNDIACMIGEIVMAGGVRRAALISFSDPDDLGMRHAKDWSRGSFPACRYMANNSAFWTEKPNRETFDAEWTALRNSGSGERGFFMFPKAKQDERRGDCRSNPCVTGETRVMTEGGLVRIEDLATMSGSEGYRVAVDLRFGQGPAALTDSSTGTYAFKTGTKDVFLLQTEEGHSLRLTADHRVMTTNGWKEAQDLQQGDLIHIANTEGMFGCRGDADAGMLAGWVTGDGTILIDQGNEPRLYFYESDHHLIEQMVDAAERLTGERPNVNTYEPAQRKYFQQAALREYMGQVLQDKGRVPEFVWQGTEECQRAYLSALFSADGSVGTNSDKGAHVRLHSSKLPLLRDIQRLLLNFGINSRIYEERRPAGFRDLPDGKGGYAPYKCEADHDLHIAKANLVRFYERVGFIHQEKQAKLAAVVDSFTRGPYRETFTARFKALIPDGTEDVYDMTVPGPHSFMANGIVVHNCGEILLRYSESTNPWTGEGGGGQFCNLSAAVMRSWDTRETFANKVRIATWIGAIQSTFTDFPHLRIAWKHHCDEDRLLGVDITGHCDNPSLSGDPDAMLYFNQVARETAAEAAAYLDIPMPAAITCGKPSGNSSQLVDCASGFHTRYAAYYIRRVRIAGTDPLFHLIRDAGVPVHKDNQFQDVPDDKCPTWVAEFPVKSPEGAMIRSDETAIEQLNRYLQIMRTWCSDRGHNQSATVYVRDHEWDEVGDWVFEHFDEITGLSFLPYDGGKYRLAPYEEITEEQYNALMADFPEIDWSLLPMYETEDMGEGAKELACVGGACEIDYDKLSQEMEQVEDWQTLENSIQEPSVDMGEQED